MFRLFECCALSFFERFVLSFSLKIERFVSDSAEILICGLYMLGFSKEMTESLIVKKEALKCSGKIYSEQHRRNFDIKDDILRVENDPDDESRLNLTINRKPIADWFREQWHRLRYGARVPQQEERKSRGFKL